MSATTLERTGRGAAFLEAVHARRNAGGALLATNFYNAETLLAVLRAAREAGDELILQTSPSTLAYLGVETAAALARAAAREAGVRAWLHLDHAADDALIERCLEAGWDSVMIDASEAPFDENVARTRAVAERAHASGAAVEAELGYVPKLGQREATEAGFTAPEEARRFVEATGVDLLAVAVGTAHGFYKREPKLDLPRLERIRAATDVPLVLHGASGVPPAQWRAAIARGVAKINFATEIKDAFTRGLRDALAGGEIDLRKTFPPAMDAVTELVAGKLRVCRGEGGSV
ncbi:MAG: class II fructose-bisphosphate aldolase [Planctomycetota bacterium]|nr:class II fructose-bisphosphate aldolase [Planctomycetota bacterium]